MVTEVCLEALKMVISTNVILRSILRLVCFLRSEARTITFAVNHVLVAPHCSIPVETYLHLLMRMYEEEKED